MPYVLKLATFVIENDKVSLAAQAKWYCRPTLNGIACQLMLKSDRIKDIIFNADMILKLVSIRFWVICKY